MAGTVISITELKFSSGDMASGVRFQNILVIILCHDHVVD